MAKTAKVSKKQTTPKLTEEELAAQEKQRDLNKFLDKKERYLNPTKSFKVGDILEHVNAYWDQCTVLDVYENIFYYIKVDYIDNQYGKKVPSTRTTWIPWNELRLKAKEARKEKLNKRELNIDNCFSFSNRHLSDLTGKHYHFGVNNTPDYQRDLVWTLEDKQALIDSIFKGIDIGKFVFISLDYKPDSPCYEILDGKQRMNAIIAFMEDRFEFDGYKFSDLSMDDRRYFDNYSVTIGESRGELTPKQKYEYFLRLNTRGREQSAEHIEKVKQLLATEE